MHLIWRLAMTLFYLLAGTLIGLGLFELSLRLNPGLMLRGMAVPAPVEARVETQIYDVYTSDADIFFWQPEQVRPIPTAENQLEAHVTYSTDELGFPNQPPLPARVDIVILGRSYAMGAQAENPWPHLLAKAGNFTTLNLSQTGSGIDIKLQYLNTYGLPHHPRWVIIEILPAMDIVDYNLSPGLMLQRLPFPVAQSLIRRFMQRKHASENLDPIYPLKIQTPVNTEELVFFNHYLETLSIGGSSLEASRQWQDFSQQLLEVVELINSRSACPLILYVPTKENIYLNIAIQPGQLSPALDGLASWELAADGFLERNDQIIPEPQTLVTNTGAAASLLAKFASQHRIAFLDPSGRLTQAAMKGEQPFMRYDTHWSGLGHQLVAEYIFDELHSLNCP